LNGLIITAEQVTVIGREVDLHLLLVGDVEFTISNNS
jgi:hypothetical protein